MSAATFAPTGWQHEQTGTATVEALMRAGMRVVDEYKLGLSPSKVSRMVRSHIARSNSMDDAARSLEAYFLTYADPTGETAVNNLMRGGHR